MAPTDPTPPNTASDFHKTLHATAVEFIRSGDQDLSQPKRMSETRLRAIRSPTFQHTWGHNYFVSTSPQFQGTHDLEGFTKHLNTMLPMLESWETYITDVVIDEARKMAVARASYWMKPKGAEELVENDLIWWLWMTEDGKKVEKGTEFIDGVAGARLRDIMKSAKQ